MEKPKSNPKRLFILIAIAFGLSSIASAITPKKAPRTAAARPAPRCQTAEANIHDNLTLYRDAGCTEAIGKISGIGRTPSGEAMVFIIEADGTEQQVTRRSTKDWFVIN
jgi:hypothetical protein